MERLGHRCDRLTLLRTFGVDMFAKKLCVTFTATLAIATPIYAASSTVKCHVISDTASTAVSDADHLRIDYRDSPDARNGYVDTVSYVATNNVTGDEVVSLLHGQGIRGGYDSPGYCNPDDHGYSPASQTFSLYANCVIGQTRVRVTGNFGMTISGSLKIRFYAANGTLTAREIATEACE